MDRWSGRIGIEGRFSTSRAFLLAANDRFMELWPRTTLGLVFAAEVGGAELACVEVVAPELPEAELNARDPDLLVASL